ncbi:hypothetical protein SAMN05444671_2949 [Flavobacterium sp. CF108]|uniref:hypothetical protein n=1 Tax=unclassified Flavobacterium TaxID=196869 RepID=UPI0008CE85E3|nr:MULTISPECIES: hypothetical protein [unclassified Flavobacterium]SEP14558.1 hypothetical protein SAMN04487978_4589 [Flavobacterium sp. fv08]SHH49294.1 hypothetical protein SAMN05444671_2949 [Flavobacterium sp. CF108]
MEKHIKYLIALFLAFVVIAGDGTLYSQSKSAEYYQSSFVVLKRELNLKSSRLYKLGQDTSCSKTRFSLVLNFLKTENVFTFQIKKLLKLQDLLHQKLTSFINQSVFINEIITSKHFTKSLYNA